MWYVLTFLPVNLVRLRSVQLCYFLGAFTKLRIATISFVMSVRLSVRTEQLGSQCTDFHGIRYLGSLKKILRKKSKIEI